MNKIVSFIKQAGALNLTAKDIQPLLKKATGHDVPEHEIQKALQGAGDDGSQGASQHPGGSPGGDSGSPLDPTAGAPAAGGGQPQAPDLSGISPMPGGSDPSAMAGADPSAGGGAGAPPIDPQELAALQQQFPQISPEDLAAISQAIEEYLAQMQGGQAGAGAPPSPDGGATPPPGAAADAGAPAGAEAQGAMPPMPPTKQGSYEEPKGLQMVKKAEYIEGFLKQALYRGFTLPEAVDLYGEALQNTAHYVKQAAEVEKYTASIDDKTASYCEGIYEQAAARGLTLDQTVALLKQSGAYEVLLTELTNGGSK